MVPRELGQRGDFGGHQVAVCAWGGRGGGGLLEPGGVEFGTKAQVGVLTWSWDRSMNGGVRVPEWRRAYGVGARTVETCKFTSFSHPGIILTNFHPPIKLDISLDC